MPWGCPEHVHYRSLSDTARLLRTKAISPVELTQHMLDRVAAVDRNLKSYVTVMPDRALAAARRAEAEIQSGQYRGPLHGMPIGVKDLCYTRGVATAAGTKIFSGFVPDFDATVVTRLQDAGAVILGKQTLCEGAFGPYHPELEVPVNPWNPARWSGVSSSGSAVAAAAGLCFGSIGTDTGGSIRYPSAANGCVGLKPTYGRVSRHGVFPLAESMDHVGPMARTVRTPPSCLTPSPELTTTTRRHYACLSKRFSLSSRKAFEGSASVSILATVSRTSRRKPRMPSAESSTSW